MDTTFLNESMSLTTQGCPHSITMRYTRGNRPLTDKQYITAEQLLDDAFQLGARVLESGFAPDFIVAIWRGGTPIGIAIQEFMDYCGVASDHIAIRTSYYSGIGQTRQSVEVHGLNYIINRVDARNRLLLVDDVFDTGASIDQVIRHLGEACADRCPEIRVATPYFKPKNNATDRVPDFYLHESDSWLVFPHELNGLSKLEIAQHKPGIEAVKELLLARARD